MLFSLGKERKDNIVPVQKKWLQMKKHFFHGGYEKEKTAARKIQGNSWEKVPVLQNRKSDPLAPEEKGRARRAITAITWFDGEGKGLSGME